MQKTETAPNAELRQKVRCPYCGQAAPVEKTDGAQCKGIFVKCKGRNCGREFEIEIPDK